MDGKPDFYWPLKGGGVEAFVVALEVGRKAEFEAGAWEPLFPDVHPCVVECGDAVGIGEDGVVGGGDNHAATEWDCGKVRNFEGAHVLEAVIRQVSLTGGSVEDFCGVQARDGELVELDPLGWDVAWGVGEGVEAAQSG